jgi:UDP-3-O-[3-hydroxymyristoyl] glucosamine N-acyltransferase
MSRQNDARTIGQRAHIGAYALVALDAQIAGSVLRLTAGGGVVLCR